MFFYSDVHILNREREAGEGKDIGRSGLGVKVRKTKLSAGVKLKKLRRKEKGDFAKGSICKSRASPNYLLRGKIDAQSCILTELLTLPARERYSDYPEAPIGKYEF
jgi:hypothetical protein